MINKLKEFWKEWEWWGAAFFLVLIIAYWNDPVKEMREGW